MKRVKHNPDRLRMRQKKSEKANEMEQYLDQRMQAVNREIAKTLDKGGGVPGSMEQNSGESLAKPKKRVKSKSKKVNFYPASNQGSEGEPQQNMAEGVGGRGHGRVRVLPPRHPDSHVRHAPQPADLHSRRNDSSRRSMGVNSSVENYQRYYQEDRPDANLLRDLSQTQSRIEPEAFNDYNNHLMRGETAGGVAAAAPE